MIQGIINKKTYTFNGLSYFRNILIICSILFKTTYTILPSSFYRNPTISYNLTTQNQSTIQQVFSYVNDYSGLARHIYKITLLNGTYKFAKRQTNYSSSFYTNQVIALYNQLQFKTSDSTLNCPTFYNRLTKEFRIYQQFTTNYSAIGQLYPGYQYPKNIPENFNITYPTQQLLYGGSNCNGYKINKYIFAKNKYTYRIYKFYTQDGLQIDPIVNDNLQVVITLSGIYQINYNYNYFDNITMYYRFISKLQVRNDISSFSIGLKTVIINFNLEKFILYGTKYNQKSMDYQTIVIVYIINNSKKPVQITMIQSFQTIYGQLPTFYISQNLTKVLITGKNTDNKPLYNVLSIDFNRMQSWKVSIPKQITTLQINYIRITDYHFYINFETQLNIKMHALYFIYGGTFIRYFNQSLLQNQTSINVTAIITELVVITVFGKDIAPFITLYYKKQSIAYTSYIIGMHSYLFLLSNPLNNLQYTKQNFFTATIYFQNLSMPVVSSITQFRFLMYYSSILNSSYADIYFCEYPLARLKCFGPVYFNSDKSLLKILTYHKKELTCFIGINYEQNITAFYILSYDYAFTSSYSEGFTSFNYFDSIIKPNNINVKNASITVNNQCKAIKINNYVLIRNSITLTYENEITASSWQSAQFDQQLKMAISQNKLYQFNGTNFEQIISSDFYPNNLLYFNSSINRLFVLTYNLTNNQSYIYKLKLFHKINNTWQQVSLDSVLSQFSRKIIDDQLIVKISQNFQNILISYVNGKDRSKRLLKILKVDYIVSKLISISYPKKISQLGQNTYYHLTNNMLYVRTFRLTDESTKQCYEMIYQINKFETKLQIIRDQILRNQQATNWNKSILYQIDNENIILADQALILNATKQVSQLYPPVFYRQFKTRTLKNITLLIKATQLMISFTALFNDNGKLSLCRSGCKKCSNGYGCQMCQNGFQNSFGQCKQSALNCRKFNGSIAQKCQECYNGYFRGQFSCLKCHNSCLWCVAGGIQRCSKCHYQYYLGPKRICLPCPDKCSICINSTHCQQCIIGYALTSQGSCKVCPLNCISCKQNKMYLCQSCISGYELAKVKKIPSCVKCPERCLYCTNGICDTCQQGFQLNLKRQCIQWCSFPCIDCNSTNLTQCQSCINPYVLVDGQCLQDISCNDNDTCSSCPMNYVLIFSRCYACSSLVTHCLACSHFNLTQCAQCEDGYYITSINFQLQCNECSSQCSTCISDHICTKCSEGYVMELENTPSPCIPCQGKCQRCRQTPQNCQKCKIGYEMHGNKCLSSLNITYKLILGSIANQMKSDDFELIQVSLIDNFNKSKEDFHILNIYEGSVVIQGVIETSKDENQKQIIKTLSNIYSSGSFINNFPIVASQFVGSLIYPPQEIDRTTLIIILSISIPATIIIIILVIIVLCKKFKGQQIQQIQLEVSDQSTDWSINSEKQKKQLKSTPTKHLTYFNKSSKTTSRHQK